MEDEAGKPEIVDDASAPQFSAFISYSHADGAAVRKLHSQIESYRLPKGLGSIDALNRSKGSVGRIFRDREDLSAAHDLSTAVKGALERSQALVVACSPDARASQWVDKEIVFFRECHPDRPILAAILRGEPHEAIPLALMQGGVEPLAADLRKQGDGWRLGFLKIVAGIAGVPLDRLVQRDSQRQVRRVTAVTGLVALVAVAMGVMTTIALQARNEARFQQAEAEGLVSYMLGELRTELKGVGRLDVMQGVNERVLTYYSAQGDLSDLPPESLEKRTESLLGMGEVDELQGDLEKAAEKFAEAHRTTAELLEREPDNPERIYAHAQSEYWLGYDAWRKVKPDIARPYWTRYWELSERLLGFDPANVDWVMEAGFSASNLGLLAMRADGNFDQAALLFSQALARFEEAGELSPEDAEIKREIADAHAWVADAYRSAAKHDLALQSRKRERRILDGLIGEDPQNAAYQSDLIGNAIGTAQAALDGGRLKEAGELLSEAKSNVGVQTQAFPTNQKLKLQERVIALLQVKADPELSSVSRAVLANCVEDSLVQGEPELAAFCSILRKRAGMTGEREAGALTSPFPNMRLTPRWGLELNTK